MITVENTGKADVDIHGTLARAGSKVSVTDRQLRVFKASASGAYWLKQGTIKVKDDKKAKAEKPPAKALPKAKESEEG